MKHKVSKQIISSLLALVMVIGLIPASTLTAYAAEKTEVTQIETRISAEYVPYAGRDYTDLYTYDDSDIYGAAGANPSEWWVDDAGVTIEEKGNGDYGEWYDIRYQFEAGRTYTAVYTYMINTIYEDTYKFTENTTVTLTNPDPSKCTITGEVIEVRDSGRICDVRYTMTIAGERSYPDIKSATLQKIATPADGVQAETTALMYSNCTLTSQAWSPNVSTFAAGNTYTLTVNLHAKDGYKFADDFAPVLGIKGYEKAADSVQLLNSKKDAAVSFTYSVGNYTFIDTLELEPISNAVNFFPVAGESARYFPDLFKPADSAPYEKEWLSSRQWYNEDDKCYMEQGDIFEAGKTYSYYSIFQIKTENEGTHRFASPTVQIENFIYQNDVQTEVGDDPLRIYVTFYYTCKFPAGAGSSAKNPAVCHSYWEFKYAMENKDIHYVALGNVEDVLPSIPHDEEQNPGGITTNAIVVRGTKDLNLLGNAVFKCPLTNNYDLKYYTELMTLTSAANSDLYIHGEGSLTYEAGNLYFFNSAIKVAGGSLTVDGATVCGSNGYHTGYCYGINALYGGVVIQGGATIIGEVYNGYGVCALSVGQEGLNQSLSVSIWDGKFYVDRDVEDGNYDHGICVNNDCGLRIYGGIFDGIKLRRYAANNLSEYIQDGCVMTINGQKATPAYYSTIDGKIVEVYKEISKVGIHVNSPAAGEAPATTPAEVYLVPEGATVKSITWYENNELWNDIDFGSARFEAGNSYKVDIVLTADSGVKFANPLTSATINYKTAKVSAHAGKAETGIVLTVDFGACPNTISNVDLTVTAPKEGNKPSYTVGCASDAYSAVGGSSNYTNYRKWYMSSDGYDWWEVGTNHQFMSGYYYKFVVDIKTASGNEFQLYDNGSSIVPDVSATVNGYYASVIKAYDQDPSTYITVEYNFGECNDSVVENITVENVIAPVAGEKPNYSYSIRGNGYQMDTSKNAFLDVYWKNPSEKWYYVKNGISWWDVTDGGYDYVYENDTFIPGHQYQCKVYLKVDDGFEFAYNNGTPTVSATMNGNAAEIKSSGSGLQWEQQVTYTFTCSQAALSAVEVSGIDAPVAGQSPDYTGTVGNAALYGFANYGYNAAGFWWYDSEDNPLTSEDKFVAGETYRLEIKLTCATIESVVASRFQIPVAATLNGKTVDSSDVMANSTTVYIYQTYTCKEASAVFVSGSVTSFNDASGDITLQLIPEGLSEPAYETIVTGNTVDYYFADVAAGTYTLKVSKANHVTREYTVVVGNSSVIQDVKIHLKGDITGDGRVNTSDVNRANLQAKGKTTLSDYEFACADVTGDGRVNTSDVNRINLHAKGKSLMW
mgnify:CR=1 FL=1